MAFNRQLLKEDKGNQILLNSWKESIRSNTNYKWNYKTTQALKAVKLRSDEETKKRKQQWTADFEDQFDDIFAAKHTLQASWNDQTTRNQLNGAQSHLQRVCQASSNTSTTDNNRTGHGLETGATRSFLTSTTINANWLSSRS